MLRGHERLSCPLPLFDTRRSSICQSLCKETVSLAAILKWRDLAAGADTPSVSKNGWWWSSKPQFTSKKCPSWLHSEALLRSGGWSAEHYPMIYKFGYCHCPYTRFYNHKFGYHHDPYDKWEHMKVLYISAETISPGFVEASLIQRHKGSLALR